VAIFSKGTLLEVHTHGEYSFPHPDGGWTRFSREFLEVHLELEGWRVIVFNAHFKSKNQDDAGRRLAEAKKANEIVREVAAKYPQALIILGGDLNDTPGSDALEALQKDNVMSRVGQELTAGSDWTYNYNGIHEAIDHLFLVLDTLGGYVSGTAKVVRDSANAGYGGSDHAALRARFRIEGSTP
jgi:endonuclease/exonuclease/phosphatase (EEP) superfamily protein YafD